VGFLVCIFTIGINFKSFPRSVQSVQGMYSQIFQTRWMWFMRVDNTADNADISQSHAANHHGLLSHVTLGLVKCRK